MFMTYILFYYYFIILQLSYHLTNKFQIIYLKIYLHYLLIKVKYLFKNIIYFSKSCGKKKYYWCVNLIENTNNFFCFVMILLGINSLTRTGMVNLILNSKFSSGTLKHAGMSFLCYLKKMIIMMRYALASGVIFQSAVY